MKQEFIAMVSHDLRSPLTAILATFDLLSNGVLGNLTEKGGTRIDMAKLSLKRLINLINDLLDLDKLESGTIEVDLKSVTADSILVLAAESLRGMAEQNDINLEVKKNDIRLLADEDRLMQVLTNFVSNAIKFSPADGVVTLSCQEKDGFAEFRVDDNGRGIPPEMVDLVFERFKQVSADDHKVKKGSGLGLAISKAIIEAHGGTIGVTSTVGVGSSFWFRIPNDKQ
ncbi:MAG: HAMP domain-containing sensor histidine kinase [Candidatus Melainabacteria bacterium]|nr:HAMP domain-containing sensor histidine kinase [Candidatus Melainabacteria bacterium]